MHAQSVSAADTDWVEIECLYSALYRLDPSPVVRLNHAVSLERVRGPAAALEWLEPLGQALHDYRWFHAILGEFRHAIGDAAGAREALEHALSLTDNPQERAALQCTLAAVDMD